MTVKELKEFLNQFDEDLEVKFTYNYGDYWHTSVAADINDVESGYVTHSSYHNMDKLSDDENEDDKFVVLLS